MKSPARFLFFCFGLATVCVVGNLIYARMLDNRLSEAVARCEEENQRMAEKLAAWVEKRSITELSDEELLRLSRGQSKSSPKWELAPIVCDPAHLEPLKEALPGVQGKVVFAKQAKVSFENGAGVILYIVGLCLAVLGLLPFGWYFFLRRLREIAAAVRGD